MLNSFLAIGRLGQDATVRSTKSGVMATFSLAVDRYRGRRSQTDWIPCSLFGDRAQALAPYLTKGILLGVRGRLESWKDQDGVTRFGVNVTEVNFLSRKALPQTEPAPEAEQVPAGTGVPF